MAKLLIGIEGERFPKIGEKQIYKAIFSPNAKNIEENKILWQLYHATEYDDFTPVSFSGQKKGLAPSYTFLKNLLHTNLLLRVSYNEEVKELRITPKENNEVKIIDVFFTDLEYKVLNEQPQYLNSVNLQIYTVNMKNKSIEFKIFYVLDGKEIVVAKSNTPLIVTQNNGIVKTKQPILLHQGMAMQTMQDLSAREHCYQIKLWEVGNESNIYEDKLKVRNEIGKLCTPTNVTPVKTGETEKKEEKKKEENRNPCSSDFTLSQIKKVWPLATNNIWMQGIVDELNKEYEVDRITKKLYEIFDLNTCLKRAHFFAQAFVESTHDLSGAFNGESLNYSVEALRSGYPFSVFKNNKKYYEYADKIGRKKDKNNKIIQYANQEEIANIAYDDENRAPKFKLGNTYSGDGWKFRGRGLMQITGRSNYKEIQEIINKFLPNSGIDLSVGKKVFSAKEAVFAGLGDWILKKANHLAENGDTPDVVDSITKKINLATKSYEERRKAFLRTKEIFKKQK